MVAVSYRVDIERDESGAWIARIPDVPGCHSYGRTLRQVKARIREALGLWIHDAETAELEWHVRLPASIRNELRAAQAVRARAVRAHQDAQQRLVATVRELTNEFGLSVRDAADLIGLSHQRVQQLVGGRADARATRASRSD